MELCNEAQQDDASNPDQAQNDGDAVEVTFSHTRGSQSRAHAAAEHIGDAATATLVEEDQQGEEQARDAEQHLQNNLKNFHSYSLPD